MQQAELLEAELRLLRGHLAPLFWQVCLVAHDVEEGSVGLAHSRRDFGQQRGRDEVVGLATAYVVEQEHALRIGHLLQERREREEEVVVQLRVGDEEARLAVCSG